MKRKTMGFKNGIIGLSMLFLLLGCETGYKGELPSTEDSTTEVNSSYAEEEEYKFKYKETSSKAQVFEGGYLAEGLDISNIRQSQHGDMLRLVFDSKGASSHRVGTYSFVYYPDEYLITAIVSGYQGFSATFPTFSRDSVVEKIYMDEQLDESSYKFHIQLREDSKVKVFSLDDPARIVVDISPL